MAITTFYYKKLLYITKSPFLYHDMIHLFCIFALIISSRTIKIICFYDVKLY